MCKCAYCGSDKVRLVDIDDYGFPEWYVFIWECDVCEKRTYKETILR